MFKKIKTGGEIKYKNSSGIFSSIDAPSQEVYQPYIIKLILFGGKEHE